MLRSLLSKNNLLQRHLYKRLFLTEFIAVMFFVQSCDTPRYVYSAPTQNIPHLTKKGDFTVAGFIASGTGSSSSPRVNNGYSRGSDFQGAYAVSNKIGVMANRFARSEKSVSNSTRNGELTLAYKRRLTEYGTGYLFPKKKSYSNTYFQLFAGAAIGKFSIDETGFSNSFGYTRYYKGDVTKIFIQPAVILSPGNFSASFSSRFCSVKYHNISTDYDELELKDYFLDELSSKAVYFWEPVTDISYDVLKHKGLKLELQMGIVILLNKKFVDYRTMNFGIGIRLDQHLFRKKPSTDTSRPDQ